MRTTSRTAAEVAAAKRSAARNASTVNDSGLACVLVFDVGVLAGLGLALCFGRTAFALQFALEGLARRAVGADTRGHAIGRAPGFGVVNQEVCIGGLGAESDGHGEQLSWKQDAKAQSRVHVRNHYAPGRFSRL